MAISSLIGIAIGSDSSLRVAIGLRLGVPICGPHLCQHCVDEVDVFGRHGLSCKWSEGRLYRHSTMNLIIKQALSDAHVPSKLEPSGLFQSDERRPDSVSLIPWRVRKLLGLGCYLLRSFHSLL